MVDPGFPVGGRAPVRGGVDLRCGCFLVKMYVKMKEFGPTGGGVRQARPPPDPPMQTIQKVLKYWTQNIEKYTMGVHDEVCVGLTILYNKLSLNHKLIHKNTVFYTVATLQLA